MLCSTLPVLEDRRNGLCVWFSRYGVTVTVTVTWSQSQHVVNRCRPSTHRPSSYDKSVRPHWSSLCGTHSGLSIDNTIHWQFIRKFFIRRGQYYEGLQWLPGSTHVQQVLWMVYIAVFAVKTGLRAGLCQWRRASWIIIIHQTLFLNSAVTLFN